MKLAQLTTPIDLRPSEQFTNLGAITFQGLLRAAIVGILIVAAVIFFFMLIIGGIKWITSGGDKQATEGARGQITAALIGLVVVFSAWAIITLINAFFGIDLLSLNLPSPINQ